MKQKKSTQINLLSGIFNISYIITLIGWIENWETKIIQLHDI